MEFLQFLVQCMSASLLFSLTLNWNLQQISSSWSSVTSYWSFNKTFHPQGHILFQVFEEKKKKISDKENILYLTEVDETVVIASVFYFSIVDKHAKIICIGCSKRSRANLAAANMQKAWVVALQFYRHCLRRWANHKFK